jgi:hypothetical protein
MTITDEQEAARVLPRIKEITPVLNALVDENVFVAGQGEARWWIKARDLRNEIYESGLVAQAEDI